MHKKVSKVPFSVNLCSSWGKEVEMNASKKNNSKNNIQDIYNCLKGYEKRATREEMKKLRVAMRR